MSEKVSSSGISVFTLLGVMFIGLKLTGHISWSWWYVTLPFWGPPAVLAAFFFIALVIAAIALALD